MEHARIAIIMTVHNRRDTTKTCLIRVFEQKGIDEFSLDVYMTDDGSTDGTSEVVKECFPSVNIIEGDGTLFWNRGMYVAWKEAVKYNYDFYLWLNDDTIIFDDAIKTLMMVERAKGGNVIVVGSICSPGNINTITYGGRGKCGLIHPMGEMKQIQIFNGNLVLIPMTVYKKLGLNDPKFSHAFGDSDYGMRAAERGIKCFVTPKFVGTCERHDKSRKCWKSEYNITTRFLYLYSPLGYPPNEVFYYYRKHFGILKAIIKYVHCHLKTLFPCVVIPQRFKSICFM